MRLRRAAPGTCRTRERGVVLIIALIVLVAMALAGIALVRSVDVTTQVASNLAFRQSGVQASDAGVEHALKWLMTTSAEDHYRLDNDKVLYWGMKSPSSYYPTWNTAEQSPVNKLAIFDPATFIWDGTSELQEGVTGNKINYVIHRMCRRTGPPDSDCFTAPAEATGNSNAIKSGEEYRCAGNLCTESYLPYYRITVRVEGPRNTVTYIQSVVY